MIISPYTIRNSIKGDKYTMDCHVIAIVVKNMKIMDILVKCIMANPTPRKEIIIADINNNSILKKRKKFIKSEVF